ncbi:MAG TPA: FixH family protein [Xanthomonadales bacterium]
MNSNKQASKPAQVPGQDLPWYRQFWPWFIIALPTSAVIASFVSLWLAVSNPDQLVVTDDEYLQLKSELKAQTPVKPHSKTEAGESDPE